MKTFWLLLPFLLVGCVSPVGDVRKPAVEELFGSFEFPVTLSGFDLSQQVNYEKQVPGGGIGRTYRNVNLGAVTIYLYDQGKRSIPDGVDSETVIKEFFETAMSLQWSGQEVEASGDEVAGPEIVEIDGVRFWRAEWEQVINRRKAVDYLFLTGYGDHFFKIRMTLFADAFPDLDLAVEELMTAITGSMPGLASPGAGGDLAG